MRGADQNDADVGELIHGVDFSRGGGAARCALKLPPGALPGAAPDEAEPFEDIVRDFDRVLMPGMTHWNHPGFMAYFAASMRTMV